MAAAAVIAVVVGGVAIVSRTDDREAGGVGVSNGAGLPGRIIARCLHNMPIPVGDEMGAHIVIEMCAMTPEGEVLGRLPDRAIGLERDGLDISPDGLRLVYRLMPDVVGQHSAVVVELATGEVSSRWNMTTNGYSGDVTWSSDGGSLLFVDTQDVIVQPIDGSEAARYRAVDRPAEFALRRALMSPDSNSIAVATEETLVLIDLATHEHHVIDDLDPWSFTWSLNSELAVVRAVADPVTATAMGPRPGEVVILDPSTLDVSVLLEIGDVTSQPAWSPDGEVLFVTDLETGWFVDPDAAPGDRVIRTVTYDTALANPGWAPDGSAVVAQTSPGENTGPASVLLIIDGATGEINTVVHDPLAAGSIGVGQAAWVPGDWSWDGLATRWPAQDPPYEPAE